jgi:carbonic anhydrase
MGTPKLFLKIAAIALFALGILLACSTFILAGEDSPHWAYGGAGNPTRWGRLDPSFATCAVGRDQSPIDIGNAVVGAPAAIEFNYTPVPLVVVNTGHTIQVNYVEGSTVNIDGEEFELSQFHFHTPSEHVLSGQAFPMELHLVHRNVAGKLAVVGVMIEEGITHPTIDTIWENLPEETETSAIDRLTINAADLLPSSKTYFSYTGSLTTPPCSEGVKWNVLEEPIQVSEEQIALFENLYPVNARPIQSANGRMIERHVN